MWGRRAVLAKPPGNRLGGALTNSAMLVSAGVSPPRDSLPVAAFCALPLGGLANQHTGISGEEALRKRSAATKAARTRVKRLTVWSPPHHPRRNRNATCRGCPSSPSFCQMELNFSLLAAAMQGCRCDTPETLSTSAACGVCGVARTGQTRRNVASILC